MEIVECGGEGDCGFLSLITSLKGERGNYREEVSSLRDLLGKFYDKNIPPPEGDGSEFEIQKSYQEPDLYLPDEDVSQQGVYMQDKDINALVHLLDLEEVVVKVGDHEQKFTQLKEYGKIIRSHFPLIDTKYKGKKAKILQLPGHFKAFLLPRSLPSEPPSLHTDSLEPPLYEKPPLSPEIKKYGNWPLPGSKKQRIYP